MRKGAMESSAERDDKAFAPRSAAPSAPMDVLSRADGEESIAVSKKMKSMKEEEKSTRSSDPVRVAGGRTFLWRSGGWIDSEAAENPGKQLKVKYLSAAYFQLVKVRPELKDALALGNRVVVMIGKGKSVVISPTDGEEAIEKVDGFLK